MRLSAGMGHDTLKRFAFHIKSSCQEGILCLQVAKKFAAHWKELQIPVLEEVCVSCLPWHTTSPQFYSAAYVCSPTASFLTFLLLQVWNEPDLTECVPPECLTLATLVCQSEKH